MTMRAAATDTLEVDDGRLIKGFVDAGYAAVKDAFVAMGGHGDVRARELCLALRVAIGA
jgi:hypothetical protein